MSKTPALAQKARLYLNLPFFIGRAVLYFAIWGLYRLPVERNGLRSRTELRIGATQNECRC